MSKIEWTGITWNPTTGCDKISAGCKNCYAETMSRRLKAMGQQKYKDGFQFRMHEDALNLPYTWKKPQTVFVNSMSDLFHEDCEPDFIKKVFAVMNDTPQHTYQVLTKRSNRLALFGKILTWTPNIWVGVSVENQKAADERIPHLLKVNAAVRFLSCEPLLGPIDLRKFLKCKCLQETDGTFEDIVGNEISLFYPLSGFKADRHCSICHGHGLVKDLINWVITGGESGHKARPVKGEWIRSLRDQCKAAGVAFFFKQWGEYVSAPMPDIPEGLKLGSIIVEAKTYKDIKRDGDIFYVRMGKKAAGRLLDGVEHNEMPAAHTRNSPLTTHKTDCYTAVTAPKALPQPEKQQK